MKHFCEQYYINAYRSLTVYKLYCSIFVNRQSA